METITIDVELEIANLYKTLDQNERNKINLLLGIWLKDALTNRQTLKEIMDQCSQEAQQNGLTPEILESILLESR
jgi:ABC-type uncharacterized transport system involved in gliding motility auxiliary subunit